MQPPIQSNSTQFEAQYTSKGEERIWKTLTLNVSNAVLKKNITPEKIRSIVPHLLAKIGKPERRDENFSQEITIIDYDPNRHLFRFEYNNKEDEFSEYAKSTITLSQLKLKQKGKSELEKDDDDHDLGFLSGTEISIENLIPELAGKKLTPQEHLRAFSKMLRVYSSAILEQTLLKENELQKKSLTTLARRSNETAITAEKFSEVLSNEKELNKFLNDHIANLKIENASITLPFGYHREGGQFIPLFLNLTKKDNNIIIQTVVIDPALKRKVIPFQTYSLPVNQTSNQRLYNLLRTLAQFTKQIPETKKVEGASPLVVMNAAIQIAGGGEGRIEKIEDQVKAIDVIINMINTKQVDEAEFKNACDILDMLNLEGFDPKRADQQSKDVLADAREKLNKEKAGLETPEAKWQGDDRDVFTIIESLITMSGATKQPSQVALVGASHDRFKIVANWLLATSNQPEHFKYIMNEIEANITTRLINYHLEKLDKYPSLTHKIHIIEQLEKLLDRYIKHRKKEVRDEKRLLREIETIFGPFRTTISELKKTLVQQSYQILDATIEKPHWSYKIQGTQESRATSQAKSPDLPLFELEQSRRAIAKAVRNNNISELSKALAAYTEKCKHLFVGFNYPELIKAVQGGLDLLPVPSDSSVWGNKINLAEMDAISKAVTTLTQYAWEAHLKTGRTGCYPNEVINLLNTKAILTKLIQIQAKSLQRKPAASLSKEEKQLLVYANFTCDTEQAIHLLTRPTFLRYAKNPDLELKSMALLHFYQIEQESKLPQITLDSYRQMIVDKNEQRFLDEIGLANGLQFPNDAEKFRFYEQTWAENWHREQPTTLPKVGIDLRRNALFIQTMLHPDWVMVKGFEKDLVDGISKASWLGIKVTEAAAETGETDSKKLLKIVTKKETVLLKENIFNMGHLELTPGEDSEKGFENRPAINFTDKSKKYQVGYHPRGFIAAELRNPYHDSSLIGQEGQIPEQIVATRTYEKDVIDKAKSKRKREMEGIQQMTEMTVLQEEQYSPSTSLSEAQNAQLRTLVVQSSNSALVSPLTCINVFNYIWQNPDQLENENIQRILEEALLSPGLIRSMLQTHLNLLEANGIKNRLKNAIQYSCQNGRVKSALFLMHLGSLIKTHAANILSNPHGAMFYGSLDPSFKIQKIGSDAELKKFQSDISSFQDLYLIKGKEQTGLAFFDRQINSGELNSGMKKFCYTYILDFLRTEKTPPYSLNEFIRILQGYAVIKNIWGDHGDPIIQREVLDWVEKIVIPEFKSLNKESKDSILSSIARGRSTSLPIEEVVSWSEEHDHFKSVTGTVVNIERGFVRQKNDPDASFHCDLPDEILLHTVYNSLFGSNSQTAIRILKDNSQFLNYEFEKDGARIVLTYQPLNRVLSIYQNIDQDGKSKTFKLHLLSKEGKHPASFLERFGIWQNIKNPSEGIVILSSSLKPNPENSLSLLLEGNKPNWQIADCRTMDGKTVLADAIDKIQYLFPFADPSDLVVVLQDVLQVEKGFLLDKNKTVNKISEIRFISKGITLKNDPEKGWTGTGDYNSYQLTTEAEKIKEVQTVLGVNSHQFALPFEKIIVTTTRTAKEQPQIVRKRQSLALIMPVQLRNEGGLSALSQTNTDFSIKPLQVFYETEEAIVEEKAIVSRSRLKSTSTGFVYLAYAAFVEGDYDKAAKFLADAMDNPFAAHETKALETVVSYIRKHQDESIRGTAFKLKLEIAVRKIERDRKGLKEFRPASWENYLKKAHQDITLYQHYRSRMEDQIKKRAKIAVLGPLLVLTPEETLEYEQLIKESLQVLLHNLKEKPIWESAALIWQSRVIPPDVFIAFSHELAHHMQPPDIKIRIENQLATTTASQFLANFWSYADQIKKEGILETDWRIDLLKNVVLTGIPEDDRKYPEVARQLLITFSKINSLMEKERKKEAVTPEEEKLIERYQKFQAPPGVLFNKILSSESSANAEKLKKELMQAAGWMIWRSVLEALNLADPVRFPTQIYNQLDEFMLPLRNFHNELIQPIAAQAAQALPQEKSKEFETSIGKLQSVLNDKQQSTFSVEELNFWKKAVEFIGKKSKRTIDLLDVLRGAVAGTQLNLAAKRHETEVLRSIRAQDKPKTNAVRQPKKDPPLGRETGDHVFIDTIQKYRTLINDYFHSESWEPGTRERFGEILSFFNIKPTDESNLFSTLYEEIRQSQKPEFLNNIVLQARAGVFKTQSKKTLPATLSWHLAQAAKIRLNELNNQLLQTKLPAYRTIDPKKPLSDINQQAVLDELRLSESNKAQFDQRYSLIRNSYNVKELNQIADDLSSSPFSEALLIAIAIRKNEIKNQVLNSQLPHQPNLSTTLHSIYKLAEASHPLRMLIESNTELTNLNASRLLGRAESKHKFNQLYRQIKNSRTESPIKIILNNPENAHYTSLLIPIAAMRILELRSEQPVSNLPELGESNQELPAILHNSELKNAFSDKYETILLAQKPEEIVAVLSKEHTPYNKYLIQLGALRLKELSSSVNPTKLPHVIELTQTSFTEDLETAANKLISKDQYNLFNAALKKTFLTELQAKNVPILTLAEVLRDPNLRIEFLNLYDQILKSNKPSDLQKGVYDLPALRIAHLLSGAIALRNTEMSEGKSTTSLPDYRDFTIQFAVRNLNERLSSYTAEDLAQEFQFLNERILSRVDFNPLEIERNINLIRVQLSSPQKDALDAIQNEIVFTDPKEWEKLKEAIDNLISLKTVDEIQDFLGNPIIQKIIPYLIPFSSIRQKEISLGIKSSFIPNKRDLEQLVGKNTSSTEKIANYKNLLINIQEFFIQSKQIKDIQSLLETMLPNHLYLRSLGLLYHKVRSAVNLDDLNNITEALVFPQLGGLLLAIRSKELEIGQLNSSLVDIREPKEIFNAIEGIFNPFTPDDRKEIGREAARKIDNLRFKIRTLANPSEITQLYNEIIKTKTINDLENLIYHSRSNVFQHSDLLLPVAAIRYKELHDKQVKSNLKEMAAFDPQILSGIKVDNEILTQIAARNQAFALLAKLNEEAKRATIDTRCSEIRSKGEAIIQSMLSKDSSPMEKAENELLATAIRDEIIAKQNDIKNDRGVLPKNPARLTSLRNLLSGQVQFLIKDTKQRDILQKMKEYPEQFPGLSNMINRPDVFSDEEIFEKALDLYKSHQLINKFPNDPKMEHTLYLVEVWLTKYLYNVTELIQLNKALETLTQMEPLAKANPQTLSELAAWDVEWEEKSKTLLGFLQGAGNKERYIDKKTFVELDNPAFSRRHLVAEYRNEMIARPAQPITVEKMVKDNNSLILLRPGAGKSKWITPEVAQLLAQEKDKMPIILVTEELVHINRQDLDRDTRKMFNQAGHIFDFNRNTPKDVAYLSDEYKRILDVKASGGYIVTTIGKLAALDDEIASTLNDLSAANKKFHQTYPELLELDKLQDKAFLQQFKTKVDAENEINNRIKKLMRNETFLQQMRDLTDLKKQLHGLQKLHSVLRQDVAYVSDEVDDIFNINRDYNYSLSGPDGSGMRKPDTIVSAVMDQVMSSILDSKTEPLTTLTAILQNNQQSILAKIEINDKGEEVSRLRPFLEAIAGSIYDQKAPFGLTEMEWSTFLSKATKEQFVNFVVTGQKGLPIPWDPNNETLKRIAALKHILMITLPGALALKADVDYGLGPDGYSVVPKKEGESIPNVRYGDEYELITFQYLYHASKAPSPEYFAEQWRKEEDLLESEDPVAKAIWKTWKQEAKVDEMPAAERQKALYAKYSAKDSWKQRLTLLRKDILENKIKLYSEQIKCNAQDPLSKEVTNTGASGTVNEYSLPDSFNRDSTVMSRQVMADTMIKLAIMNKEGINQPVVVFTEINDVIKKGTNNRNCKFIIDQGSATEGRTTPEIVDYIRSVSPDRQILFVANVVEHGKQVRRQMMLNPGLATPEPFDKSKLSKDCLVYFGPPDIRGTDWPIPPGEGILITGATTTEEQLLQAIWRARKLGSGQTVQLYLHESVAKSIKPDGKVTIGEALNDIKKRTLDVKAGINLKATLHKIKNIIPQEVKKELFKTSIGNEEEYWSLDVTKDKMGLVDAARALKILTDIDSDCKRFDAARGLFIEKREINFESDYSPTELKEIERVVAERFEAERRKLPTLLPLGEKLIQRMKIAIDEAEAKFKAEFEERHKKNLKPKISTAAGGSSNSQEQVQEQQQQQQQQMVSLKMEASKPKPPMPDKKLNSWVNWTTKVTKGNMQQHFMNPAADANDPFNLGMSAASLFNADCGFSPYLLMTENYRRIWNEMKVHENELMGRIAVIQTNHDFRFILIDQLDFDKGFLPSIEEPSPDFAVRGHSISVFALNPKSNDPLICNAATGTLDRGANQNQYYEQLVQVKVLAGCLAFNDVNERKALERWIGNLNPEQKTNLLKLYCKMRKADNVGQIYGWLDSPLSSLLK